MMLRCHSWPYNIRISGRELAFCYWTLQKLLDILGVVLDLLPLLCGVRLVDWDVLSLFFVLRLLSLLSVHEAADADHNDQDEDNDNDDDHTGVQTENFLQKFTMNVVLAKVL